MIFEISEVSGVLKVFGAFSTNPFHVSEHFLGTGECFLFTFVGGFKVYSWSGKNTFFSKGGQEGLTIGTGRLVFFRS